MLFKLNSHENLVTILVSQVYGFNINLNYKFSKYFGSEFFSNRREITKYSHSV